MQEAIRKSKLNTFLFLAGLLVDRQADLQPHPETKPSMPSEGEPASKGKELHEWRGPLCQRLM